MPEGVGFAVGFKPQHTPAFEQFGRQGGGNIQPALFQGVGQDHPAGVEVQAPGHIQAVEIGLCRDMLEFLLRAFFLVFSVPDNRAADELRVDANLMRTARARPEGSEGGILSGGFQNGVLGDRGFALIVIDQHLFLASALALEDSGADGPAVVFGDGGDQGPVDFLDFPAFEHGAQPAGGFGRAGKKQDSAGVLIQPVDEARHHAQFVLEAGEQAINMAAGLGSALHGEIVGFVQRDHIAVVINHEGADEVDIGGGELALMLLMLLGCDFLGVGHGDADVLPLLQAHIGLGAFGIHPDLALPHQFLGEAVGKFGYSGLDPAVEALAVIVGGDLEMPDVSHVARPRISQSPANRARMERITLART